MAILALLGGIWCIFVALRGKGKRFTSKMGTPLGEKEARAVKITYLVVGILLLVVAVISSLELLN